MIKLEHVSKFYKTKTGVSEGMRDVSAQFELGEFIAVTGESGSGKTTLLNVISGLDSYEDGELYVNKKETSHYTVKEWEEFRAANVGFVFQNYNVIDSYSVYQNVVVALEAQGYNESDKKTRALELIDKVGLTTHKNQKTSKLSGGQKQRVVIARALAKNAPIILADEPTGNLDTQSGKEIMELLKEISEDKLIVLVTHNYEQAAPYVTRKIVMHDATIKEDTAVTSSNRTKVELRNINTKKKGTTVKTASKLAARNILTTPKRTIFSILLSLVVIVAFMFFYVSLIKNTLITIDDSSGTSAIIEFRAPDLAFDKQSVNEFINNYESKELKVSIEMPFSQAIVQESIEYRFVVTQASEINENYLLPGGSMPQSDNELVLYYADNPNAYTVGDTIKLVFIDENEISTEISYTVVGLLNEDYDQVKNKYFRQVFFRDSYLLDDNYKFNNVIYPEENLYSLTVEGIDRQEIKLLKSNINNKYRVIDKYIQFENQLSFVTGALLLIFWVILIGILSILFLVAYNVQKNVMESRKKDFAVYRSIGVSEQEVGLTILFEQIIIALISLFITIMILSILSPHVLFIRKLTRHIKITDYLVVSLVFTLFSVYQGLKFNKKIFNITVIESLREDV